MNEFYFVTVEILEVETDIKVTKNIILDKNPIKWLTHTRKHYKDVSYTILFFKEIDETTYYDCKNIIGS